MPALAGEIDTVTSLTVRRGSAAPTVTLREQSGRWTVAERADYPADVSKLRKLLLALSDARLIEEKTSNPASFALIGVEDPSSPGAGGAEIAFAAKDGKHAVIIGKPVGEGNFARRVGENTSYSVEPGISFEAEPRYWIDSHLLDVAAGAIQSVRDQAGGGTCLRGSSRQAGRHGRFRRGGIRRGRTGADCGSRRGRARRRSIHARGRAAGTQAGGRRRARTSPSAFSALTADDVAPAGDIDFRQGNRGHPHPRRRQCDHPHRHGRRRQALDSGAGEQGCGAQRQDGGPRIRNRRLSFRRRVPAARAIAGSEGAARRENRGGRRPRRGDGGLGPAAAAEKASHLTQAVISGTSAGFGRRVAALLYDCLLLAALLVVYTSGAVFLNHRVAVEPATAGAWIYPYRAGLIAVVAGYYLINWLRSGQTLGMRAWHLRAVADTGKPMAWKAALLRIVFGALAWAPAALGVLWLYVDPEHLAMHDRLSKTRVVHLQLPGSGNGNQGA